MMLLLKKGAPMSNENKRRPRAEWFNLIDEQASSGLSQTEFCKQRGLSICKFGYYKKLHRSTSSGPKGRGFVPVVIGSKRPALSNEIKINLPNGFSCIVPIDFSADKIKQIIGALISC